MSSSINTTQMDGDLSLGRNIAMGGKAEIAGSVSIGHGLKVNGWLDAPNIKAANKGMFLTLEALQTAYPEPQDGWFAGVGDSTPFDAYTAVGGEWVASGGTLDINVDITQYSEDIEQAQQDIIAINGNLSGKADDEEFQEFKEDVKDTYGKYKVTAEFIDAMTDAEGRLLEGTKDDGTKVFSGEIESPTIDGLHQDIQEVNTNLSEGQHLGTDSQGNEVRPSDIQEITLNEQYIQVVLDTEGKVLYGVDKDGNFTWSKGVPPHLMALIEKSSSGGKILPLFATQNIQKAEAKLTKGYIGIQWKATGGFTGTDNQWLAVDWMFDNWNITTVRLTFRDDWLDLSTETMINDLKRFNTFIKKANEHNVFVHAAYNNMPTWNGVDGAITMEKMQQVIDMMCSYDGKTDEQHPNGYHQCLDGSYYPCKIDSIAILDEVEDHRGGHDASELLKLYDYLTTYIRSVNADMKIQAPSSGHYVSAYHSIGALKLLDGRCFADLFDLYSIDVWSRETDVEMPKMLEAYAVADPRVSYSRPCVTTHGYTPVSYSEVEQGEELIKSIIRYLRFGAECFTPFGEEYDVVETYDLFKPIFTNASHMYYRLGNGASSLTDTDAYDDVILRIGRSRSWSDKAIINPNVVSSKNTKLISNLKASGLWIKGETLQNGVSSALVATQVDLRTSETDPNSVASVLWTGEQDISQTAISIASSAFSSLTSSLKICVTFKDDYKPIEATGLTSMHIRKGAYYIKFLNEVLCEGCTRPTIQKYDKLIVASWYTSENKPVYLLWVEGNNKNVSLSIEGSHYVTDLEGKVVALEADVLNIDHPVYIFNANNIKIN